MQAHHSHPVTDKQAIVLDALASSSAPLSAYTLLDQLRDRGFRAPLQVYRALDKLIEYELVHKLESINAFVACHHDHGHSHCLVAFAICRDCGHVDEFCDRPVEERLSRWSKANAFKLEKTHIEMRGICSSCLAA